MAQKRKKHDSRKSLMQLMSKDNFLVADDALARSIAEKAQLLYDALRNLDVDTLGMPYHCLAYFKGSHFKRLYFSIETSAHLLYRCIRAVNKPVAEIVLMDYGAGVGTLYTLAKMIGCRKVIYNDHLEDWKYSAELIGKAIAVEADEYIVGDIPETLNYLDNKDIQLDVITTRNVIEHIYKLDHFYNLVATRQPQAWIYSSTTANFMNPASRVKHWLWHRKWEKQFVVHRFDIIKKFAPQLSETEIQRLAVVTRGQAGVDIENSVRYYIETKKLPAPVDKRSNTSDPGNGVWFEHMLSFEEYRQLIGSKHYKVSFFPGFWDTHYSNGLMNSVGRSLNSVIRASDSIGLRLAPFIYVVAEPKVKSGGEHE
jgi:hypothetical protein